MCLQRSLPGQFHNLWYTSSEPGPSCSRLDQIPSLRVIDVCFIMPESGKSYLSETLELDPFQRKPRHNENAEKCYFTQCCISNQHSKKYSVFCCVKKPFCSRCVGIWEDHQICGKQHSRWWDWRIQYGEYEWVALGPVSFQTEIAPFGEGGFHYAFKASSNHHKFRDATYVIKRLQNVSSWKYRDVKAVTRNTVNKSCSNEFIVQKFSCIILWLMCHCY